LIRHPAKRALKPTEARIILPFDKLRARLFRKADDH